MRGRLVIPCLAVASLASSSSTARAQEIVLTGPLRGACPAIALHQSTPARTEWDLWASGGVALAGHDGPLHVSASGTIGAELTFAAVIYEGLPAHVDWGEAPPRFHSPRFDRIFGEVRVGPWVAGTTRAWGAALEGGAVVHLGTVHDEIFLGRYAIPYGHFDLRAGTGYAAFPDGRTPDVVASLAWGARWVVDRWSYGNGCDPAPKRKTIADATVVRLVLTGRRALGGAASEAVLGVEVTPTMAITCPRIWRASRPGSRS